LKSHGEIPPYSRLKGTAFSQQLRGVNLKQVLIVAIDAAKLYQKARIDNYFGDVIEKPFFFSVNQSVMQILYTAIEKAIRGTGAVRFVLRVLQAPV